MRAIDKGVIRSAHDVSEGGLAVALAECCMVGPESALGVKIELHEMMRVDALLFGESQSRIIVSVEEKSLNPLKEIAEKEGAPMQVIGVVGGSRFEIQPMVQLPVEELKAIWAGALEKQLTPIQQRN